MKYWLYAGVLWLMCFNFGIVCNAVEADNGLKDRLIEAGPGQTTSQKLLPDHVQYTDVGVLLSRSQAEPDAQAPLWSDLRADLRADLWPHLWSHRYWLVFAFLLSVLLLLYVYTVQLRHGIGKRTAELEAVSSDYKSILDSMRDAYYRADLEGELKWVSLACERQLGYQRHQLIGQPLEDLYYDNNSRNAFMQALAENAGQLQHYEVSLRHKDGSEIWTEVNAQYVYDKQGNVAGVEGNVRNISERKKAQRDSQELTDQLQQAQKMESIGVLAGGIAHDFNNLLVGVMGNAELAMLDAPDEGGMRHHLQQIFKSSQRGADLVHQLLAYSGQGRLAMGEQDLNGLIRDVSELLSTVIGKQVLLEQMLMADLPQVYGDKNQLTQLIMNLMTNASEAMRGKPGEIRLRTGLRALSKLDFHSMYMTFDAKPGDYVFVEVSDSGCGMNEQTKERIFDPFFTTKEAGSGLGLAALLGIVKSHDGALSLQTQVDKGTCFTVFLPAKEVVEAEQTEQTGQFTAATLLPGAVLVVDDEAEVRDVARMLLEREGIRVMTANDGEQAVQLFRQHHQNIGLVLMDLTMPVMDGEQAFHCIQAIAADTPVLLSSGFSESDAAERLKRYGLAGFVKKPYTRKQLLSEVARLGVDGIGTDLDY